MSICSKVVLKKSKRSVLVLLALTAGIFLHSQEVSVDSVRRHGEIFLLDCRILLEDTRRLLSSLNEGNTVMIGIRLREGSSESSLFNPRAGYYEYQRRVSWDSVERLYVIEDPEGERRFFSHKDALLDAVLSFRELPIQVPSGKHSFRLRGEIQWKMLLPPLNILSPFLTKLRSAGEWKMIDLYRQKSSAGINGE